MFIENGEVLIKEAFNKLSVNSNIENLTNQNYENIILTGSTGFLGIHILNSLINRNLKVKIYLIIRKSKSEYELNKLHRVWNKYINKINLNTFGNLLEENKINIINGDISSLNWNCELPSNSILIHSAGIVNTLASREHLKDNYMSIINIYEEVIKKNIHFMFISTLSIFVSSTMNIENIAEEKSSDVSAKYYGGYAQTKFIAEKLVETFPNFTIIRPSLLTGSSFRFKFPDLDYFKIYIGIIYKLNIKPLIEYESFFNFVPVDLAADYIIKNVNNLENNNKKIIHIANPNKSSIKDILNFINLNEQIYEKEELLSNIEKKLLENSLNINYKLSEHKDIDKYFNVNLFQGNQKFETNFNSIDNNSLIGKYINSILNKRE